jgi:RHS repeat-associated protein
MSDKSGAGAISLPKGGGAVSGLGEKFSPDLFTGTGNFSVPIALPPGRNGFQPELTLGYSTGNGQSAFGLGWNLGVPGVMRKTSKGIPRYDDEQDVFILSGAEDLVPIVRTELTQADRMGHKVQYRPRTEGLFARIEHYRYHDAAQQYYDYWLVWSKDGLRSFYGAETLPVLLRENGQPVVNPANQAILADPLHPGNIFAWHLTRTVDLFGNDIVYEYRRERATTGVHQYEQTYLRRIRYVDYGNLAPEDPKKYLVSVEFDYGPRPDPFSEYSSGFEQRTTQRCLQVRTLTHPEVTDRPAGYLAAADPHGYQALPGPTAPSRVAVKTYGLRYVDQVPTLPQPLNAASLLHAVQVTGHDGAATESMPPLEFGYSVFAPQLQRFFPVGGELPATSLASTDLELLDIFGNGLPDLVQLGGGVARYWKNLGDGRFDLPRPMQDAPGGLHLADPDVQFIDANGNGTPDLLVNREELAGYFPLRFTGLWDKNAFHKYAQRPSFSFADPEVRLLDLDGDGVTDVLRNGSRFEYFYNDPEQGFVEAQQVSKGALDDFPSVSFQDPRVRLAHLCNGLQALCLVHSGRIEYWPNLGRGRWGKRVAMKHSPVLPRGYNPAHVLLGDLDGDGLDDCVYIQNNKITLWFNQGGNGWSAPVEIAGTPPITDVDAVRITDLLGSGVAGILWTRDALAVGQQQQYLFLDLTGKVKPYVLNQMDNRMGALTRVAYAPSTQYYLADAQRPETRWQTPLPFPVQVVSHVEVVDLISGGKMSTEYSYHHGYWDGGEREFRGFGRVDQRDTQSFEQYNGEGLFGAQLPLVQVPGDFDASFDASDFQLGGTVVPVRPVGAPAGAMPVDAEYYAPPLETRTWFHLGPVGDEFGEWEELDLTHEYWSGDAPLLQRPAGMTDLIRRLPRRHRRDAFRSLRGSTLRTELYALDGSSRQARPYTVTESLTGVAWVLRVQPSTSSGDVVLAFAFPTTLSEQPEVPIFFAHGLAQRTTQWERGDQPMTQVSFTHDYDNYGQARRQTSAALPQGWSRATPPAAGALVSTSWSQYAGYAGPTATRNEYDSATQYLIDRVASTRSWELVTTGTTLRVFDLVAEAEQATGTLPRRLLGHAVQYYDGPAFEGLGVGNLGLYGVLTRSEVLILTDDLLTDAYGGVPTLLADQPSWTSDHPLAFRDAYQAAYPDGRAGYRYEPAATSGLGTDAYYQTTERRQYDFQLTGTSAPARRYGLVVAMLDPLGTVAGATATNPQRVSRVSYDAYALLPVETIDALNHVTTARYDYRVLQAYLVTDPNQNRTVYGFSALGLLNQTGLLGKVDAGEGDVVSEAVEATATTPARALVYEPSTRLYYDFFAFTNGGQPCWVKTVQREQHVTVNEAGGLLAKVEYSDGFGRLLQTRAQAEDVLFGIAPLGDSGLPATGTASTASVGVRNTNPSVPNVVVSGWQVYDNKGHAVEKYEPFFSQGFAFVPADAAGRGQHVQLFYDPRGQLVRTRNPDGTEQRVLYGHPRGWPAAPVLDRLDWFEPSPWLTFTYDANDLAALTHPGQAAADQVGTHWYTPQSAEVDALGRVVRTVDRLEPRVPPGALREVVMQYFYDLRGNRTRVVDAHGRTSFSHVYDLQPKAGEDGPGANVLRTAHLDGGSRRAFFDGAGQPLQGEDAKGALTLHAYDALGRPTDAWARDRAGEDVTCRQHLEYGPLTATATNQVGQLVAHYDEAGVVRLLGYDFQGNLLEKERQVVADAVFTDQWNLAATPSNAGPGWAALPAGFNRHWQYLSELGRLTPATRWQDLSAPSRLAPAVYQTSTRYDALNRATRLTLPQEAGGTRPQLVPTYNRAGALAQVRLDGQVLVERVAYNARGQRLLLARGNDLMTRYAYDPVSFRLQRLCTQKFTANGDTLTPLSGTVRQDTSYAYDLAGNITGTTERAPDSGLLGNDTLARSFTYDALYRLLSATGRENQPATTAPWEDYVRSQDVTSAGTSEYTQNYRYDLLGNILELQHVGQGSFTRTFAYASPVVLDPNGTRTEHPNYLKDVRVGNNMLLADYGYDPNGNVVREMQSRHLQWDAQDQLRQFATWTGSAGTSPTLLAYYVYDAGGQRTKKITQTGAGTWQVTVYVEGAFEHRYEVSNSAQGPEQTTVVMLDGQSRLFQRRTGDALGDLRPPALYNLEDHLGSATATTDVNGVLVSREEYYPFGETSFGSHAKQRYRFCGKERDQESGLYYYGMRYYAPWLCRFVSVDPLAAKYTYYTPYQYAGNRPINFIDLDGAEPAQPTKSRTDNKKQDESNTTSPTITITPDGNNTTVNIKLDLVIIGKNAEDKSNMQARISSFMNNINAFLPTTLTDLKNDKGGTITLTFSINVVGAFDKEADFRAQLKTDQGLKAYGHALPIYSIKGDTSNNEQARLELASSATDFIFFHEIAHTFGLADRYVNVDGVPFVLKGFEHTLMGTMHSLSKDEANKLAAGAISKGNGPHAPVDIAGDSIKIRKEPYDADEWIRSQDRWNSSNFYQITVTGGGDVNTREGEIAKSKK